MAKRKPTKAKKPTEIEIEDITEIGEDIPQELSLVDDVTEVEASVEADDSNLELIEETPEEEICDQPQEEDKTSNQELQESKKKQEKNDSKTSKRLEESKEKEVQETKNSRSKNSKDSEQKEKQLLEKQKEPQEQEAPEKTLNKKVHQEDSEIHTAKVVRGVRPSSMGGDRTIRSSMGLFHR
jgi:hypothetical protein